MKSKNAAKSVKFMHGKNTTQSTSFRNILVLLPKRKESEELTFTKETIENVRGELIKLSYLGNGQSTCFTYDIVVNLKFQVSDISILRY